MKRYIVKGTGEEKTFVEIIGENSAEYVVMVRKVSEYETKENRETMGKELFAACVRTGYLTEVTGTGRPKEAVKQRTANAAPRAREFVA